MNLNKVLLIGRVSQEVEARELPSGQLVATINIATNRMYKDRNGEQRSDTQFHRIVAWSKLGETCKQYLQKGQLIFVEGRIQYRTWLTPNGEKRTTTEIVADNIRFGPKSQSSQGQAAAAGSPPSPSATAGTAEPAPSASSGQAAEPTETTIEEFEPQSDTFEIPY